MKKIAILYTLFAFVAITVSSCKKDPEPGGTAIQPLAGDWWVQVKDADGNFTDDFGDGYYRFSTYNTAANIPTEMWIDDLQTFWAIKGKVNVNVQDLSFGVTDSIQNVYYESTFLIRNGKIFPKVTQGPVSKAITDSIYFETILTDYDPSISLYLSGYRRTKFAEDDH